MTEVPTTEWSHDFDDTSALARARRARQREWRRVPGVVTTSSRIFRWSLRSTRNVAENTRAPNDARWMALADLAGEALPSVMRKVMAHALDDIAATQEVKFRAGSVGRRCVIVPRPHRGDACIRERSARRRKDNCGAPMLHAGSRACAIRIPRSGPRPGVRKYRLKLASVERLATGCRWSEGPVWFGDGRYLLWSDIPNNRIMRWDEETGARQRLPQALEQRQRQHPRPPGPARHLRARRAARHPHRI